MNEWYPSSFVAEALKKRGKREPRPKELSFHFAIKKPEVRNNESTGFSCHHKVSRFQWRQRRDKKLSFVMARVGSVCEHKGNLRGWGRPRGPGQWQLCCRTWFMSSLERKSHEIHFCSFYTICFYGSSSLPQERVFLTCVFPPFLSYYCYYCN